MRGHGEGELSLYLRKKKKAELSLFGSYWLDSFTCLSPNQVLTGAAKVKCSFPGIRMLESVLHELIGGQVHYPK